MKKPDSLKLLRYSVTVLALVAVAAGIYFPTSMRVLKLRRENARMAQKILDLKKEIAGLESTLEDVDENPYYLEKLVRENLGAVKDDEIIIDIQE